MKAGVLTLALLVLTLAVAGCGDDDEADSGADSPPQEEPGTERLSASDFPPGQWPLTVKQGIVRCEGSAGSGVVTFETRSGDVYGVNGTALSQGHPRIDPIWKKDPDVPGLRINISPVLDRGLALCE